MARQNKASGAQQIRRRDFLKVSGSALGLLLAGLPKGWVGGAYAADGPETAKIRFGIIALTDCSSIVMAHELGLFKKYGIESTISKEASWAAIRDKIMLGENQATHMLFGMPLRVEHGAARLTGEADDHSLCAQPQRPSDYTAKRSQSEGSADAAGAETDYR